jgi:signal transduction histidine kinase
VISHVNITEQVEMRMALKQHALLLRDNQEKLEFLSGKLIEAQDQERRRIACDLHDDVSQRLAALVLDVAALQEDTGVLAEGTADALKPVREQLERLSDDVHNLAYQLHPSLLEHAGLQPAIEDHIQQISKRTGLSIVLQARDVPVSLSLDRSTCLFRVLQESLHNIVKHAGATKATVKLSGSSRGMGVSVTDNGKGFHVADKIVHHKGLGLISMQERLRGLNGFLRIHSRPPDGTKVCAWIPVSRAEA